MQTTVMVAGLTPSGVAAALELRTRGLEVKVINALVGSLRDLYEIQPTPLNSRPMPVEDWEQHAKQALAKAGVPFDNGWFSPLQFERCAKTDRIRWVDVFDEEGPSVDAVVFAETGHQGRALTNEEERFMGKGLSWSAADERPFRPRSRIAVRGCGRMAIFQALIAARTASSVVIFCEDTELEALAIYAGRLRQSGVRVQTLTAVTRLLGNRDGRMEAIEVRNGDYTTRVEVDILFPTADPTLNWTGNTLPEPWDQVGDRLFVAGVGAGIPYWDHSAEWADGIRAAGEVLKRFR